MSLPEDRDLLGRVANTAAVFQPILAVVVVLASRGVGDPASPPAVVLGVAGLLMAAGVVLIAIGRRKRNDWATAFEPDRGLGAFKLTVTGLVLSTLALLGVVAVVVVPFD